MMTSRISLFLAPATLIAAGLTSFTARADEEPGQALGVKIRVGGRYDDVRMCVASPPGAKGGPAMDISLFAERSLPSGALLALDVPVARPILFAAAFHMLQFEPTVGLKWRLGDSDRMLVGPVAGISLHYGPDYTSDRSGEARGPSFFALGPILGGYLGWDTRREGKDFGAQIGLTPYVAPLFGVGDDHRGVVVGGLADVLLGSWR